MTASTAQKPAAKTAKPTAKPTPPPARPMPGNIGVKDPTAPATAINIAELFAPGINVLHMLHTATEPVTSNGGPPQRAMTLNSLVKRGLAELVPSTGTAKSYVISAQGAALGRMLWPDAAIKAAPRKPAARKPARPRPPPPPLCDVKTTRPRHRLHSVPGPRHDPYKEGTEPWHQTLASPRTACPSTTRHSPG